MLIRMRSQVQVLAGPPLFSQLRGLRRLGRWCSLPSWAAPGPRALRTVEPGTSRSGRPGAQVDHNGNRSWSPPVQPRSWSPDVGKHGPDDLRSHAADGAHSARDAVPRPTAILARNRCVPGRPGGRTGPAARAPPTMTPRFSSTSPLAQHGLRRPCGPALARAAARAVRGYRRAARPSWPCGHRPRRRVPRSRPVRTPRTPTRDAGRPHPDIGHSDLGHRTRGHRTRGHRTLTPDTGHLDADGGCGQGDQDTAGIRTAGPHDEPTACWTPNRVPVGAAHAARGHHNGSAVRRPASARETA